MHDTQVPLQSLVTYAILKTRAIPNNIASVITIVLAHYFLESDNLKITFESKEWELF